MAFTDSLSRAVRTLAVARFTAVGGLAGLVSGLILSAPNPSGGPATITGAAVSPISGFIEGTLLSLLVAVTVLVGATIGAFIGVILEWRKSG